MTDLRKAAEMALEFVEWLCSDDHSVKPKNNALKTKEALRQALAEPELQQRTGDCLLTGSCAAEGHKIYTAAPKREWVGLTVNEAREFYEKYTNREELIYAIDKFLEEKNGG